MSKPSSPIKTCKGKNAASSSPLKRRHEEVERDTDDDKAAEEYECPVCLQIMAPPVYQCKNGHTMCKKCYSNSSMLNCPECRIPLDKKNPPRNIIAEKLGEKIRFKCSNKGCTERFPLSKLHPHLDVCPYRPLQCAHTTPCSQLTFATLDEWLTHHTEKHGKRVLETEEKDGEHAVVLTLNMDGIVESDNTGSSWYEIVKHQDAGEWVVGNMSCAHCSSS